MKELSDIRKEINEIDQKMADLFEQRMKLCKDVAAYKLEHGLSLVDSKREEEVIKRNLEFIKDEDIKSYYVNFIKSVMNESKKYQSLILNGIKVGYSGVPGAFSYIASKKAYPDGELVAFPDFESAYKACENGEIDVVVLPIENSFAGEVGTVMDLTFQGSLKINKVFDLEVTQNLLGLKGANKGDIKRIISHPQALNQSRDFINKHGYEVEEFSNTALAALEVIRRGDKSIGVIASKEVAELYGLDILESHVNSLNNNTTRFACYSRVDRIPNKETKMGEHFILVYTVINQAGALAQTLNIIGSHGFNMRNVKSRPMKELMWNYYFFVEVEGNANSEDGREVINELKTVCDRLKLVGTYYDFKDK